MNATPNFIWLVILLGILSTTQTHLAKAFQRQGIETLDHVRKKKGHTLASIPGIRKKRVLYITGLLLNNTVFVYHIFTTPLGGTTAVYTSMYGFGLLALLLYSWKVLREPFSSKEMSGAFLIFLGTLIIGIEGILRPKVDMAWMDLAATMWAVLILCLLSGVVIYYALKNGSQDAIGLGFGLSAGSIGALDPFLKGVGQTTGPNEAFGPESPLGWVIFVASFLIGVIAFLIDQWGFYKRARTNLLVPTFNASYIAVPVILQAILLPGYALYWSTVFGLGFLVLGFIQLGNFGAEKQAHLVDESVLRNS